MACASAVSVDAHNWSRVLDGCCSIGVNVDVDDWRRFWFCPFLARRKMLPLVVRCCTTIGGDDDDDDGNEVVVSKEISFVSDKAAQLS